MQGQSQAVTTERLKLKLISLEANQPSFRTVRFNPEGISLIVGQKADPTETGGRKTFNGVGKSLSVYLTHFCLGSAPKPILKQFLPGWIFKLRFSHHGSEHVVERSTEEQTKLIYNGVPVHLEEFTKHLGSEVFGLAADTRFLSFRTLIKRFARPGKHAYLAFDQFDKSEKDFQKLLANGRLFGLSTELVQKKYDLREFETRTESLRKSLESDPIFKGYFIRDSDGRIERTELQSQMARLEARLDTFQVAEDYSEIKTEVATLKQNLAEVTAELGSIRARLSAIAKALDLGRDISRAELVQVFEQSNLLLSQGAKRSLEELEDFHRTLLEDRRSRFEDERNRLREREKGLEERRSSFADRHRELLQYLDSHGALEEYQTLSKQLAALRARFEKLLSYQEILQNYRNEVLRARHEQIEQNEAAERYLTEAELLINRNLQVFRDFSSRFYLPSSSSANSYHSVRPRRSWLLSTCPP